MTKYLEQQHDNIEKKIIALLERISTAIKANLQETATDVKLTPIQVEVLLYLLVHEKQIIKISRLIDYFQVAQPTMSDVVKVLSKKKLIKAKQSNEDARVKVLSLTSNGKVLALKIFSRQNQSLDTVSSLPRKTRVQLFDNLIVLSHALRKNNLITVDNMCVTCRFFNITNAESKTLYRCNLLNKALKLTTLRVDCPEHEPDI